MSRFLKIENMDGQACPCPLTMRIDAKVGRITGGRKKCVEEQMFIIHRKIFTRNWKHVFPYNNNIIPQQIIHIYL